jgi:hypothetical protein
VAVLALLVTVAATWNVAVGGRLLTVSVVLATPLTVVGATGARAAALAGLTVNVATVPLGAWLPLTSTLTDRDSDTLGSSTLLVGCTKFTLTGVAGMGAGAGVGAGVGEGAGVLVLSAAPPQPARAAVKASRDARRFVVFMVCMVFRRFVVWSYCERRPWCFQALKAGLWMGKTALLRRSRRTCAANMAP